MYRAPTTAEAKATAEATKGNGRGRGNGNGKGNATAEATAGREASPREGGVSYIKRLLIGIWEAEWRSRERRSKSLLRLSLHLYLETIAGGVRGR